jgi:formylmethanofuran dehydrogenase subunit E/tRNA (Thr-GGU) A37 N-methylase
MNPVGFVRNGCADPAQAMRMQDAESVIEVDEDFADALYMIDSCEYLDVVFHFHLPEAEGRAKTGTETEAGAGAGSRAGIGAACSWRRTTKSGEVRGVFASRAPVRPNRIGITTVRLLARDGNRLRVTGLDAVDGTPVLDIKSCNTSHLDDNPCGASNHIHSSLLKSNPRLAIQRYILAGDTEKLLMLAAQFHGHYCPGLAMGVMAAVHAMQELDGDGNAGGEVHSGSGAASGSSPSSVDSDDAGNSKGDDNPDDAGGGSASGPPSDGLEDLLAIVETNNCFADGVQLVTGCSFGNNSLIFEDLGKTAFTLTRRDGNGVRVISRHESPAYVREAFPEFDRHYRRVVKERMRDEASVAAFRKSGVERSFGTLNLDFDRMFDVQQVRVKVPEYAPSHESGVCAKCGDSVMATRMVDDGDASTINPDASKTDPDTPDSTAGSRKLCLKCACASYSVLDGHGIRMSGGDRG